MADQPAPETPKIDFSALPTERLQSMAEGGREVVECHRVLAKTSDNLVGDMLRDIETFLEWNHYPEGDVYDSDSHSQFYYHAHPQELRGGEHGHFHLFQRPLGMPKGVLPAPVADYEAPAQPNDALSHLIAISMDNLGIPIRLFTTNRWVTGETWYKADNVRRLLDGFEIDHTRPSWVTNRWVTGMMRLFRPEIAALVDSRDIRVAEWEAAHPGGNVYEDRELEITSVMEISVDSQIASVTAALESK